MCDASNNFQTIQSKLGRRVRSLREERHLSQEQLATACHLDRTYISDIERGNRNASLETLFKLTMGLQIDICDLFS